MIAFVSLFLGLVAGPQVVEVAVDPAVARVEIRLGDRLLGTLDGPPWQLPCELGRDLEPAELSAVAFDAEGRELGVARQRLNLLRQPAEVSLVIEEGPDDRPAAVRLAWESVTGSGPRRLTITLDGRPLPVADPHRIELPPHDPRQLHFLRAELDFSDTVTSVAELAFGGTYGDQVTAELTGVPVELLEGAEPPPAAELAGWFLRRGEPLEVVAVEKGTADAVVVPDRGALPGLRRMERQIGYFIRARGLGVSVSHGLRHGFPLGPDQRLRLLWPFPEAQRGSSIQFAIFPTSAEYGRDDAGVYWLLLRLQPKARASAPQKLADGVAVAGLAAAGRSRRRAVVLVMGAEPEDRSQLSPWAVRHYLRSLRVPFRVWVTNAKALEEASAWGPLTGVADPEALAEAVRELSEALERQRVVWVRGTHLPQEIELSPRAAGIRLVE